MAAIPSGAKDELISTKSLSPMKIVSKLMTLYQPGGTQEKMVVLRQLEDPGEQPNPGAAAGALRKWIRWRRRAEDISLSLPDPTILMRWCGTLCSWDTVPNRQTVSTFSEHMRGSTRRRRASR